MGPLIPVLIFIFWMFIIGFILGKLSFKKLIPKYFPNSKLNNITSGFKNFIIFVSSTIFSFGSGFVLLFLLLSWSGTGYWDDRGMFDYYRVPLEYPYELSMIDVLDNASLRVWDTTAAENPTLLYSIDSVNCDSANAYGKTSDGEWFLLNYMDGQAITFRTEERYLKLAKEYNIKDPTSVLSIKEYYNYYWDNH